MRAESFSLYLWDRYARGIEGSGECNKSLTMKEITIEESKKIQLMILDSIDLFCKSNNLRYSLVNIMAYIVGALVNDYMVEYTKANNSYGEDRECEWDGYEDDYIIIRLVTPTGKVKAQQEFHVY